MLAPEGSLFCSYFKRGDCHFGGRSVSLLLLSTVSNLVLSLFFLGLRRCAYVHARGLKRDENSGLWSRVLSPPEQKAATSAPTVAARDATAAAVAGAATATL